MNRPDVNLQSWREATRLLRRALESIDGLLDVPEIGNPPMDVVKLAREIAVFLEREHRKGRIDADPAENV